MVIELALLAYKIPLSVDLCLLTFRWVKAAKAAEKARWLAKLAHVNLLFGLLKSNKGARDCSKHPPVRPDLCRGHSCIKKCSDFLWRCKRRLSLISVAEAIPTTAAESRHDRLCGPRENKTWNQSFRFERPRPQHEPEPPELPDSSLTRLIYYSIKEVFLCVSKCHFRVFIQDYNIPVVQYYCVQYY